MVHLFEIKSESVCAFTANEDALVLLAFGNIFCVFATFLFVLFTLCLVVSTFSADKIKFNVNILLRVSLA